jgi:hypothetical protein
MYAVVSMSTKSIDDLADLTDGLKREYCERNGYEFFRIRDEDFVVHTTPYSSFMDWNKAFYLQKLFTARPDIEWVLLSEADATITNMTIRMEDKIDNDFHVIIPVDVNNLNGGNVLIRNSIEGRAYIDMIVSKCEQYREDQSPGGKIKDKWGIQQVMIDTIDEYTANGVVKIVPQRYMNSYIPEIYDYIDPRVDILGTSGVWEKGDWIMHWPGIRHHVRIEQALALETENKVVR